MNRLFLYTDNGSIEILNNSQQKVILIGGDFGYANFGDIAQLKGTIEFYREMGIYEPVIVYNVLSVSSIDYLHNWKRLLGINCIILISDKHNSFDDVGLEYHKVESVKNIDLLHLYGGGFLNKMWGEYVLGVSGYFLENLDISNYIISGQQVEKDFSGTVLKHIKKYNPLIFGVRDYDSLNNMRELGCECEYSFDDAVEQLLNIASKVSMNKENALLGHINISNYTSSNNVDIGVKIDKIIDYYSIMKKTYPEYKLTLFNAFDDKRHRVCDTLQALVKMEYRFPYTSYSVVDGVRLLLNPNNDNNILSVKIAIASSYHTTMLMHLCGTPCWLISDNEYYEQKKRSLGVEQSFQEFMDEPYLPDYSAKLTKRVVWKAKLAYTIKAIITFEKTVTISYDMVSLEKILFEYKSDEITSIYEMRWHRENAKLYWDQFKHFEWLAGLRESEINNLLNENLRIEKLANEYWDQFKHFEWLHSIDINKIINIKNTYVWKLMSIFIKAELYIRGKKDAII